MDRTLELQHMPHFQESMARAEAWFHGAILDRAPVRFSKHNVQYESAVALDTRRWPTLRDRWLDAEYQVDAYLADLPRQNFEGDTFPVYWPNLGPEIYAAFFGCALEFGEVTSWSIPAIKDIEDDGQLAAVQFDAENFFLRKLEEMTRVALEKLAGQALVGVTSWCPGIDCVAAWRGPENLCMDLLDAPERIKELLDRSMVPFRPMIDRFHAMLEGRGLPSVGWMHIPSWEQGHISQTDFSNMISTPKFVEFCLPWLKEEIAGPRRNIFHMDGAGVARHVQHLLDLPGLHAIQWVQGVGDDEPILQWVPLIRRIQEAGKSVVVDLKPAELDPFMEALRPEGLFLCISAEDDVRPAILKKVAAWGGKR